MTTFEKIEVDIQKAQTARDVLTLSVLRLVKSALHNFAIEKRKKDTGLSEEDTIAVLGTQAKQRKDSIAAYEKGGRSDLAEKEKNELAIISRYLPPQLPDEEIKKVVHRVVESVGAGADSFGAVMGRSMAELKGRADGAAVSRIVKEVLG
ncbi:MAG: GatB/YqeY domain-containing protein [Patescibacteria group bacterium]